MDEMGHEDERIREILDHTRTIAVVGISPKPERPSYQIAQFLIGAGYDVVGVNPGQAGSEILGRPVYATLTEVPGSVDLVDIFRNDEAAGHVTDAAARLAPEKGIRVVWMQSGIRNEAAAKRAEDDGLTVVMDRCIRTEYRRLKG